MSTIKIDNVTLWTNMDPELVMMRGLKKEHAYSIPVFAYNVNHEDTGAWCDMKSRVRLIATKGGDK